MATNNSYINALIGAAVTVVLSFIPFSPLVGGAAAGFLERRDGGRIGFISGVFASLPLFVLAVVVGAVVIPFLGFGTPEGSVIVVALGVVLLLLTYTIALSTVGGVLGVYLGEEYEKRQQ